MYAETKTKQNKTKKKNKKKTFIDVDNYVAACCSNKRYITMKSTLNYTVKYRSIMKVKERNLMFYDSVKGERRISDNQNAVPCGPKRNLVISIKPFTLTLRHSVKQTI